MVRKNVRKRSPYIAGSSRVARLPDATMTIRLNLMFIDIRRVALLICLLTSSPQAPGKSQSVSSQSQNSYKVIFKFPPKTQRKPVPFELVNGVFVFRANLSGEDVWAILDNAAGTSVIDDKFAADHNISVGAPVSPMNTSQGTIARRIALAVPFELPGQVSFTAPFSVADLKFLRAATGRPISLIIGKEYFANFAVVILPSKKTFEVGQSGSLILPSNVPFAVLEDDLPHVEVGVGDQKLKLLVDIGVNSEIVVNRETWNNLRLHKAPQTLSRSFDVSGKGFDVVHAKIGRVAIGPFVKNNADIAMHPKLLPGVDGYIGLGFLANFNFAIDVKARKLWMLAPVKKAAAASATTHDVSPRHGSAALPMTK